MSTENSMYILEMVAVVLALMYVVLAAWERRSCWVAAIMSSLLYIPIFLEARLYTETCLQLFFVTLSVYGFVHWTGTKQSEPAKVYWWGMGQHAAACCVSAGCALLLGFVLSRYTDASFPITDSLITCFSITTTFMSTKKVLENWLYWIVIDLVALSVYVQKELFFTAGLYGMYVVLAWYGFRKWHSHWLTSVRATESS